jgi:phage host-nuclease inhibitor protein Gam
MNDKEIEITIYKIADVNTEMVSIDERMYDLKSRLLREYAVASQVDYLKAQIELLEEQRIKSKAMLKKWATKLATLCD